MANKTYLTSFYGMASADDPHWPDRQKRLHFSAINRGGVDKIIQWDADKLAATDFARENAGILSQPRGYGYWLWKPYIILDALNNVSSDDYVIYHDVGRAQRGDPTRGYTLERDIRPLLRWADTNRGIYPGVYMPHHGRQKHWTKRDCFALMDCDEEKYWDSTQIQATYNVWKNTPIVRAFVAEWLRFCMDPRILTDMANTQGGENFAGYMEHRHDQSVLTNLCVKYDLKAYGAPNKPTLLHRNLNSLIRHARFDELAASKKNVLRQLVDKAPEGNFDRSAIRWVELYFCERRHAPLSVLLIGAHDIAVWKAWLPNALLDLHDSAAALVAHLKNETASLRDNYDLIMIRADSMPDEQFELVAALFPLLNETGVMVCGKVQSTWDKLPVDHRSGLALMRDFWNNKRMTHHYLSPDVKKALNRKMLIAFSSWNNTGELGNAYFIRHDS